MMHCTADFCTLHHLKYILYMNIYIFIVVIHLKQKTN